MAEVTLACLCGASAYNSWAAVNGVHLVECTKCGIVRVEKIDKDKYSDLYTSGEYHTDGSMDLPHRDAGREPHKTRFRADRITAMKRLRKIHQKYKITGWLIDV